MIPYTENEVNIQLEIREVNEGALFAKYKSSYMRSCIDLSIHTFLLASSFYAMWLCRHSYVSIFTSVLLTLMIGRTFVLFHDCVHNSYTPNSFVNTVLSHIMGVVVISNPNWFIIHNLHHLSTGNIGNKHNYYFNDTVLITQQQFTKSSPWFQTFYYWYKKPYIEYPLFIFIYLTFVNFYGLFKTRFIYNKSMYIILFNHIINKLGVGVYIYCLYETGILYHFLFSFWLFTMLISSLLHNEHTYNPSYITGNDTWTQRDSGLKSSSIVEIPFCLKYFFAGIEYHHIHHINTKIPCYNLQKYHEEVIAKSDLFDMVHSIDLREYFNNLHLVLYDETRQRYIRFDEIEYGKPKND